MFSPTRTALCIAIGAMAFAANEANAGCKRIPAPNGTLVCASWIPGSEICQVKFDSAPPNDQFATVQCSITGFGFNGDQVCATGTLPPGTLICGEPAAPPPPPTTPTLGLTTASTTAGPNEGEGEGNDN